MKLNDFLAALETLAPHDLALSWDNVGLLVGPDHDEVKHVLVALDCTSVTAREAVEVGADLLLTHHPVFFEAVRRFLPNDPALAGAYILARHGIGHVAAHTNLDAAPGGVNDALAKALNIQNTLPFGEGAMGRIGTLEAPMTLDDLAHFIGERLNTAVRVCGDGAQRLARVAVLGGSGGRDAQAALAAGAEVLITGECAHHEALCAAEAGIALIESGHYETEVVVLPALIKCLQGLTAGVQYSLTRREKPSLRKL